MGIITQTICYVVLSNIHYEYHGDIQETRCRLLHMQTELKRHYRLSVYLDPALLTVWLSIWTQHLDVHGGVDSTEDLPPLVSSVFVAGVDGAGLPVCPVESLV